MYRSGIENGSTVWFLAQRDDGEWSSLKWTEIHFLLHHHPAMSLEKVVKTRLVLPEEFLVLFLGLGGPGFRWMFSEPDLLQKFYFSICDREKKMFHQFGERQFEKGFFRARLGNSSKLGMLICKSRKMLFLSVQTDDVKLTGKKRNIDPMWKVQRKNSVWTSQRHSWTTYMGCTQRECDTSRDIEDNYRIMFAFQDLCRSKRKTILFRGAWRRHLPLVFWYGRSCKEMCRAMLWADEQKKHSKCTKFKLHALMTINSKNTNWELLENCEKFSDSACIWHDLVDQTFHGQ